MGCESSRQVKMAKLKMMSSNALNERLVENIMMNSYCKCLSLLKYL